MFEIIRDAFCILYLIIYGICATIALPFRHLFLPCSKLKPLEDDIILILGYPTSVTSGLCRKLCPIAGKVIIWTDSLFQCGKVLDLPSDVIVQEVSFTNRESLENAADVLQNEIGPPTVVINAIDYTCPGKLLGKSHIELEKIVLANLATSFWIARKVLPKMLELNKGHFAMISSYPRASWGLNDCVPYIGARCGMVGFTQSLEDSIKHHLGGADIKFTSIHASLLRMSGISKGGTESRWSIRLPHITDSDLVTAIINGIRSNQRNVYLPTSFGILLWIENFVPLEFMKKLQTYLVTDL